MCTEYTYAWTFLESEVFPKELPYMSPEGDIRIPAECCHLSILTERGIAFGLEQKASFSEALGATMFNVASKVCHLHVFMPTCEQSQLYLFDMVAHLLYKSPEIATSFSQLHQKHPYFGHAMEVLLHRVLEREWNKMEPFADEAMLPIVVKYLRSFPDFMEVVVRCTRKSEVQMWNHLFAVVGDPRELFEVHFLTRLKPLILL